MSFSQVQAADRYRVTELGLGQLPHGINDSGTVVGKTDYTSGGCFSYTLGSAFVFDTIMNYPLCDPTLVLPTNTHYNIATAINNTGVVIGNGDPIPGTLTRWPVFVWDGQSVVFQGGIDSLKRLTRFNDINDANQIVGTHTIEDTALGLWIEHAAIFNTAGQVTKILPSVVDTLRETRRSNAFGNNNQGEIVGWYNTMVTIPSTFSTYWHAAIWRGASLVDLGSPAGGNSQAVEINDSGLVIGTSTPTAGPESRGHAENNLGIGYYWKDGLFTDIGPLPSGGLLNPLDVNNLGEIVGTARDSNNIDQAFLFLPEPNYSFPAGLYLLSELVPQISAYRLYTATAINDSGQITCIGTNRQIYNTSYNPAYVLTPDVGSIVVTSAGDAPDLDPNDGRCYSGGVNADGEDNCTLRAAIEHANSNPLPDTIAFSIPVKDKIPVIIPLTPLPTITNWLEIDGTTQPNRFMVEIDGSSITDTLNGNGLSWKMGGGGRQSFGETAERAAWFNTAQALAIGNFPGHGLSFDGVIQLKVEGCYIGLAPGSGLPKPNGGHGIYLVNSTENRIGNADSSLGNVIAFNRGAGVFIENDRDNTILGNSIFDNNGIGIDLAPEGVTLNDAGDQDSGANGLLNYPELDSVAISGESATVYGRVAIPSSAEDGDDYYVELFLNKRCDSTGFGEGMQWVGSSTVVVPLSGPTAFAISFPLPPFAGWSVTATSSNDVRGNTSEFSLCLGTDQIPIIVNSTGDGPDIDPNDGICFTGGTNSSGSQECTMRAAIMEANARTGLDSIRFDIPGGGIPRIQPLTVLPEVSTITIINGSSQPESSLVELDGSLITAAGIDGLTISSGVSVVRGLLINKFSGNGLTIKNGDGTLVEHLFIGTNASGSQARGNKGHGIFIKSSSLNLIGSTDTLEQVIIGNNGGAGIFVESGTGNQFIGNSYYDNVGLGLDLAPEGVNDNDSADLDMGANDQVNFPTFISASISVGQTIIEGLMRGAPGEEYIVELFLSDTCDQSGFGEGKRFLTRRPVTTDATGEMLFLIVADTVLDSAQFFTLTATDESGNSSEFSRCWPSKVLEVLDADSNAIAGKEFLLYRVTDDPPKYTEKFLDTVKTDSVGMVDLIEYIRTDTLSVGDFFKLYRHLHDEDSRKHPSLLGSAYSVVIDNVKFDTLGGIALQKIDSSPQQKVVMDHTTIKFNLVVSIEWDARPAYIASMEQGFRNMSNYLYDVSDGQMCLDTIVILDNKENWDFCDIQVYTSNMIWPQVKKIGGFFRPSGANSDPIEMPRKWFGNKKSTRNGTAVEDPLIMSDPLDYRTRLHEFGHFALKLKDEYKVYLAPLTRCGSRMPNRGASAKLYGYMDFQYVGHGVYNSELSSAAMYADTLCRNNNQWREHNKSCWDVVFWDWGKTYGGIRAHLKRPEYRTLAEGYDYLKGPNDNLASLDLDVGVDLVFPVVHSAPAAQVLYVRVTEGSVGGFGLANKEVTLNHEYQPGLYNDYVQGNTSDDGRIIVLGAPLSNYTIYSGGWAHVDSTGKSASAAGDRVWLYGEAGPSGSGVSRLGNAYAANAAGDSITLALNPVEGTFPLLARLELGASNATFGLEALNMFSTTPTLEHYNAGGLDSTYDFVSAGSGYQVAVDTTLGVSGSFRLWAVDSIGSRFFFNTYYAGREFSGGVSDVKADGGSAEVEFDTSNGSLARALILSSPYPVIRSGLEAQSQQAGDAQALSIYPKGALIGSNRITIRYQDQDLSGNGGSLGEERSLRIFLWDENDSQWKLIGGGVDTSMNEVTASISEAGIYAAFTTEIVTGIEDEENSGDLLPKEFEIRQNYPNPFNPSTTIEFAMPKSGHVRLDVFNVLGRRVTTLLDERKAAGYYRIQWDGRDSRGRSLASGLYFYRINAEGIVQTKKMLLLK